MPAILPAVCGFVAGLAAGLLMDWTPWTLAPLAAAGAFFVWRQRGPWGVLLAAGAAGVVWGSAAMRVRAADCRLKWPDGTRLSLVVTAQGLAAPGRAQMMTVVEPARCRGDLMVMLPVADTASGRRVVVGTWRRDPQAAERRLPPRPARTGRLMVVRVHPVAGPAGASSLRIAAERRLRDLFGSRRWPIAAALTISPDAALPEDQRAEFRRSGLMHILSISGFHVGILAAALILLLRLCRLPPAACYVVGTLMVAGYVALLGAPAPALRSAALLALWSWARVRQRPPLPAALLAATALAVVVLDPWAVFEPGPWLSFAGVWGCASASRWWRRVTDETRRRVVRRRLRWGAPVAVSVGATLATTPFQLLAFGTITPIGIAANLAAIPLAAFAVPTLALALLVAALPVPGAMAAAAIPAGAAGIALDGLEQVAALAARASWATFDVDASALAAVLAAALAFWLLRAGPPRRPARTVLAARGLLAAGAVAAIGCWRPWLPGHAGADGDGRLALHLLAVGQGDAAAIRTPHGQWIVIDGGPRGGGVDAGARKVVPFLRRHGVRRIAVLVASHGDADHLGGLPAVLTALPVDLVLEPGSPDGRPLYREWLAGVARDHARWHAARAGERLTVDGVTLRIWHPDSASIAERWEANENSVVLTVEYGAFRAVFGGDAGLPMERRRAASIGDVTVLKVGHHGSRGATSDAWIGALKPEVCVIEVGARNRYGHPDPGVVARLMYAGCAVWRTDRAGDVRVATDGRTVVVQSAAGDTTFLIRKELP
jgi:competence protein ComEC